MIEKHCMRRYKKKSKSKNKKEEKRGETNSQRDLKKERIEEGKRYKDQERESKFNYSFVFPHKLYIKIIVLI